ncbi:MAG TPA: hypothetical protein PKC43_06240 [Phycisphaerales bacterium]|nr:hypothetical protein [Phycisphaerales bacterium]HMP37031.1 hypothetical protein [Phycisphaerales bacterium]
MFQAIGGPYLDIEWTIYGTMHYINRPPFEPTFPYLYRAGNPGLLPPYNASWGPPTNQLTAEIRTIANTVPHPEPGWDCVIQSVAFPVGLSMQVGCFPSSGMLSASAADGPVLSLDGSGGCSAFGLGPDGFAASWKNLPPFTGFVPMAQTSTDGCLGGISASSIRDSILSQVGALNPDCWGGPSNQFIVLLSPGSLSIT